MNQQRELRMRYADAASIGLPAEPVSNVQDARNALQIATNEFCNVLEPLTQLQHMPPNHQIAVTIVQFPTEDLDNGAKFTNNGLWYREENGDLALTGKALSMIASAAGIQTVPNLTHQLPPLDVPHFWRCQAGVRRKTMDGEWRIEVRKHELDLRSDDTPAARRMASDQMRARARQNGLMLCESKAFNRAIRHVMTVRSSYSWDEARAPFVFCRLLFVPPDTREVQIMQAAAEFGIAAEVFGGGVLSEPAPSRVEGDDIVDAPAIPDEPPAGMTPREYQQQHDQQPAPRQLAHDPLDGIDPRTGQQDGTQQPQRERVPARADPADVPGDAYDRWGPPPGEPNGGAK